MVGPHLQGDMYVFIWKEFSSGSNEIFTNRSPCGCTKLDIWSLFRSLPSHTGVLRLGFKFTYAVGGDTRDSNESALCLCMFFICQSSRENEEPSPVSSWGLASEDNGLNTLSALCFLCQRWDSCHLHFHSEFLIEIALYNLLNPPPPHPRLLCVMKKLCDILGPVENIIIGDPIISRWLSCQ